MKTYLVAYVGSALIAALGMPRLIRLARRKGLVDRPGVRRIHTTPVPRVGGIMIAISALAVVIPVFLLDNVIGQAFRRNQAQIVVFLLTSVSVFLVGLLDDLRNVAAMRKLLALIAAALAICLSGARITSISFGSVTLVELGWLSWPATILWIVAVTVGMNFIDGLDGLAGGIAAIVAAVIAVMAFYAGQVVMSVLMVALLGSLTGFLFFNFNPARIFMGDCGSMFLGFFIAAGSVVCVAKSSALVGIAIPALALGVPLLDAGFTVIRRGLLDRRSVFSGERGHIHHRLLDLGLKQRQAVSVLYAVTLLAALAATTTLAMRRSETLVLAGVLLVFLLVVFHAVGVARIRETVAAIRRHSEVAQEKRAERHCFEEAQLRIRQGPSVAGLWEATCDLADKMDFERLAVSCRGADEAMHTTVWSHSPARQTGPSPDLVRVSIPIRNGDPAAVMSIEADVHVSGSLEAAGRRVTLLGRLIDEWLACSGMHVMERSAALFAPSAPNKDGRVPASAPRATTPAPALHAPTPRALAADVRAPLAVPPSRASAGAAPVAKDP